MQQRYLTLFLIAIPVFAQDRAAINGTVTDASGALVTGATVELKSQETGLRRATLTDQGGRYQITPLPVGTFALTIAKAGFRPTTVNQIDLQYSETRTIDARLEVGRATDTVEVSATAEAVNRTNAEVGAVIEPQQIKEIPVSGRNWASLSLLVLLGHKRTI
jgi:Carboxypeptidase regulatory-like domain